MEPQNTRFFFPAILLILAYEWLVSGLDKLFSGTFVTQLHQQMIQAIPDMQYGFYARLLQKYCIPHCEALAVIVETGEILVGASFVLLAVLVATRRLYARMAQLGVVSGVVGAVMTLNFYFYQGGSFFVATSDPFDEGIPIDLIMTFTQIAVAAYFWSFSRQMRPRSAHQTHH